MLVPATLATQTCCLQSSHLCLGFSCHSLLTPFPSGGTLAALDILSYPCSPMAPHWPMALHAIAGLLLGQHLQASWVRKVQDTAHSPPTPPELPSPAAPPILPACSQFSCVDRHPDVTPDSSVPSPLNHHKPHHSRQLALSSLPALCCPPQAHPPSGNQRGSHPCSDPPVVPITSQQDLPSSLPQDLSKLTTAQGRRTEPPPRSPPRTYIFKK